ncbi:MAG: hypothetical protein NZ578_09040 [Candidatus Binatia bacterium]|nr:hypothetical protein [Candidatus Binatia bacterium]
MVRVPRAGLLLYLLGEWLSSPLLGSAPLLPADYFPLAVGNRWVYESSEGTEAAPALESWEVIDRHGQVFVVRIQQPFVTTEGITEQLVSTPEGIGQVAGESAAQGLLRSAPQFFLKAPLQVGTSWRNRDGRYAITLAGESVTVPAGTFTDCLEVTRWSAGGTATVVTLYAPGVGMVQREERFQILGGIGGFDTPQQGRTVLRLKEWRVETTSDREP